MIKILLGIKVYYGKVNTDVWSLYHYPFAQKNNLNTPSLSQRLIRTPFSAIFPHSALSPELYNSQLSRSNSAQASSSTEPQGSRRQTTTGFRAVQLPHDPRRGVIRARKRTPSHLLLAVLPDRHARCVEADHALLQPDIAVSTFRTVTSPQLTP
jgi:hypothetical protein